MSRRMGFHLILYWDGTIENTKYFKILLLNQIMNLAILFFFFGNSLLLQLTHAKYNFIKNNSTDTHIYIREKYKKVLCCFIYFHFKVYGSICIKIVSRDIVSLANIDNFQKSSGNAYVASKI